MSHGSQLASEPSIAGRDVIVGDLGHSSTGGQSAKTENQGGTLGGQPIAILHFRQESTIFHNLGNDGVVLLVRRMST